MKQITFEGVSYEVPRWAKYIARDGDNSVWCFEKEPRLNDEKNWVEDGPHGLVIRVFKVPTCMEIA